MNLDDSPEEINVIAFDDKDRKYPMPPNDEFDSDVLEEFVEDFLAGMSCRIFRVRQRCKSLFHSVLAPLLEL